MARTKVTREQVLAARAAVEAEIATLDPIVGHGSEYGRALADGTHKFPAALTVHFAARVRWEKLTDARREWLAAEASRGVSYLAGNERSQGAGPEES